MTFTVILDLLVRYCTSNSQISMTKQKGLKAQKLTSESAYVVMVVTCIKNLVYF